jgi:hypothetical protein
MEIFVVGIVGRPEIPLRHRIGVSLPRQRTSHGRIVKKKKRILKFGFDDGVVRTMLRPRTVRLSWRFVESWKGGAGLEQEIPEWLAKCSCQAKGTYLDWKYNVRCLHY